MFSDQIPEVYSTPPVILSPLRKLQRPGFGLGHPAEALPPIYSYDKFDVVLNLSPNEVLGIQEDQTDYICGVQTNGRICRKSLYCRLHLLEQKNEVSRSLPLECLIAEEMKNGAWFRKRRMLTKLYYDCKAYWQRHPSASMTPMTCSRTSCMQETSNLNSSPKCVSVSSQNAVGVMVNSEEGAFSLLKRAFLKRVSRSVDEHKEDLMSYLFYKLTCYEAIAVDIRVRELEARYSTSEADFETGQE